MSWGKFKRAWSGSFDDLFTHDLDRVESHLRPDPGRGIRKRYFVNVRLEIARRPDVLRKMEQAGFSMLMLGVESAHDKTLRAMRKGFDVARIRKYFEVLRHSRMFLHGYFIVGCIGESRDDMLQIAPFARAGPRYDRPLGAALQPAFGSGRAGGEQPRLPYGPQWQNLLRPVFG